MLGIPPDIDRVRREVRDGEKLAQLADDRAVVARGIAPDGLDDACSRARLTADGRPRRDRHRHGKGYHETNRVAAKHGIHMWLRRTRRYEECRRLAPRWSGRNLTAKRPIVPRPES